MATKDILGNEVGDFVIIDSSEADIAIDAGGMGGRAKVLGAQINYQKPLQPVAVFGADVVYAFGQPTGSFSFSRMAGDFSAAYAATNCKGSTIKASFGKDTKCQLAGRKFSTARGVVMNGAVFNGFSIQGSAQSAFFTENVSGVFHYLSAGSTFRA